MLLHVELFNFAFFVHHVFSHDWIVLFDFHLAGHVALVLVGGVKMTRACRRI